MFIVGGSSDAKLLSFDFCLGMSLSFLHFWKTVFLAIVFLDGSFFFFFLSVLQVYKTTPLPLCCHVFLIFFVIHITLCCYLCIWKSKPLLYSLQTGFSMRWHSLVGSPGWWNYVPTCSQLRLELGHMTVAGPTAGSTIGEPVTRGLGRLITQWMGLRPKPCSVGFGTE